MGSIRDKVLEDTESRGMAGAALYASPVPSGDDLTTALDEGRWLEGFPSPSSEAISPPDALPLALRQARYVLRDLQAKNPDQSAYGKLAQACEIAADQLASPPDARAVVEAKQNDYELCQALLTKHGVRPTLKPMDEKGPPTIHSVNIVSAMIEFATLQSTGAGKEGGRE